MYWLRKWIERTRSEVAKAARKRKDEEHHKLLQEEEARNPKPKEVEEEVLEVDPNLCTLNVCLEGKEKVHELALHTDDDTLRTVLERMPKLPKSEDADSGVFQVTCVTKRLFVKSTDKATMNISLRELKLTPAAALVIASSSSSSSGKKKEKVTDSSS
jgi:hypothetical protein